MGIWTRWVETLFTFSIVLTFPFSNVFTFSFPQKSLWRHEDLHLFGSFRMDLPILHQQQSHQHNFSQLVSLALRICLKTSTIFFSDNPNMPRGRFAYNNAMFWPTKGEVKRLDQTEVFLQSYQTGIRNLC